MKKILAIFMAAVTWISVFASSVWTVSAAWSQIAQSREWVTSNTAVQWWVNVAWWTDTGKWDSIIDVIKNVINYALWFLWLIALVMLLVWWFKIVTAWWDEGAHEEWVKVLKNAAIGIAFIWISWFLVTFIFYVFSLVTK